MGQYNDAINTYEHIHNELKDKVDYRTGKKREGREREMGGGGEREREREGRVPSNTYQ